MLKRSVLSLNVHKKDGYFRKDSQHVLKNNLQTECSSVECVKDQNVLWKYKGQHPHPMIINDHKYTLNTQYTPTLFRFLCNIRITVLSEIFVRKYFLDRKNIFSSFSSLTEWVKFCVNLLSPFGKNEIFYFHLKAIMVKTLL